MIKKVVFLDLDKRNLLLLKELDSNARQSFSQLGKKLHLSKSAVMLRIKRLENAGIISGYYAVIDCSRLGFLSFRVYLKFQKTTPETENEIMAFLLKNPLVWWVGTIDGSWNVGILVWTKTIYDFRNFWLDFLSRYTGFIQDSKIDVYAKLRHYRLDYLIKDKSRSKIAEIVGEGPRIRVDAKDTRLLSVISSRARMPLTELAKRTGLTPMIASYRLKKLRSSGVIQGFRAIINFSLLGYSSYKVDFYLDDLTKLYDLRKFLEDCPNLVYIDETVGGGDLEAEFHFKSHQEFRSVLNEVKKKFSKTIRSYDYFVYARVEKYSYFPELWF